MLSQQVHGHEVFYQPSKAGAVDALSLPGEVEKQAKGKSQPLQMINPSGSPKLLFI